MKMKQNISIEVTKGDFSFVFHMPNGSSWGNAIDASFDVFQKIKELSQEAMQAIKPVEPVEVEPSVVQEG